MRNTYIIIVIISLMMLGALIYGFMSSGSPFATRNRRLDEERIRELSSLSTRIDQYYQTNSRLPDKLTDIKGYSVVGANQDPVTKQEYTYKVTGTDKYQLCAKFDTDTQKETKSPSPTIYDVYSIPGSPSRDFKHPKGNYCYKLTVADGYKPGIEPTSSIELTKQVRDASRISDLANLQAALNGSLQEASNSSAAILCKTTGVYPCNGNSVTNTRSINGTGWLKADLALSSIKLTTLPIDPVNDLTLHYTYCASGGQWEIDSYLEASQSADKMKNDGGDNDFLYEIGSNLKLIDKITSCKYY